MKILCKLGFHKWNKPIFYDNFSSNVKEYKKKCIKCNKIKRWVEHKPVPKS